MSTLHSPDSHSITSLRGNLEIGMESAAFREGAGKDRLPLSCARSASGIGDKRRRASPVRFLSEDRWDATPQ
jgi:hypothetical protein